MGQTSTMLAAEMLAAFFAIEEHDAHVLAWRSAMALLQKPVVALSVANRRAMSGATGIPETATPPRRQEAHRLIVDPSMSDAEYFEQRRTKSGPHVGKVTARVNLIEMIGGLARIDSRTEAQEAAAAKYRMLHERAQIGGARALDYAAVKVDTSGPSEEAVFEIGASARESYSAACRRLGIIRSSLVERVVVHDMSIGAIVGRGGQARATGVRDLLAALDELAVFFKLAARKVA